MVDKEGRSWKAVKKWLENELESSVRELIQIDCPDDSAQITRGRIDIARRLIDWVEDDDEAPMMEDTFID